MQCPGLVPLTRLPWWVWRTNRKPEHWEINRRPWLSLGLGVERLNLQGPATAGVEDSGYPPPLTAGRRAAMVLTAGVSRWNALRVEAQQCRGRRMAEMTFGDH